MTQAVMSAMRRLGWVRIEIGLLVGAFMLGG